MIEDDALATVRLPAYGVGCGPAAATEAAPDDGDGKLESRGYRWKRGGVTEVILPSENEVDVREDLKSEQVGDMKMHFVKSMEEVVDLALEK